MAADPTKKTMPGLAKEMSDIDAKLKALGKRREDLRLEFFRRAETEVAKGKLARRVVEVPAEFLLISELSIADFVTSRHPGWKKIEDAYNEPNFWILLEEDPEFLPWSYTNARTGQIVSKQVSLPSPSLDELSFKKEFPDLYQSLMKKVVTYVLDGDKLTELVQKDPKMVPVLQRHTRYGEPVKKLGPMKMAKDG